MANRSVVRGSRAARRRTHWTASNTAVTLTATGSTLLITSQTGHEGETLARVRGLLSVVLESAAGIGDGFFGALGMAIVTSAAAAAGVASIPTPLTEQGWDGWLLHRYFAVHRGLADGGASPHLQLELDSKAMRKTSEDEALVSVLEVAETGTAQCSVFLGQRVLSMIG